MSGTQQPRRRRRSKAGAEPIVLGLEYARARAADEARRQAEPGASPLSGLRYDLWRGDFDLARFVDSEVDGGIAAAVEALVRKGPEAVAGLRASLGLDDCYTLLAFARRSAVRALRRADAVVAAAGVTAVALIDPEVVDERDIPGALVLPAYALDRLGTSVEGPFGEAAALAAPALAEMITGVRGYCSGAWALTDWGHLEVATAGGPGFVDWAGERYRPGADLIAVALRVAEVVDADAYLADRITAADGLYPIWLPGAGPAAARRLLDRVRGTVSVAARLRPQASGDGESQQFTTYLIEAKNAADARRLAAWAAFPSRHAALALPLGALVCITVARSFVEGVGPRETAETLARFAPAFGEILQAFV